MAELERVALTSHISSVTKIVSIAIKLLRKQSPGIKLLISYADPHQNHHGGIYQGGNWIYVGKTADDWALIDKSGRQWHSRVASTTGKKKHFGKIVVAPSLKDGRKIILPGKHKYIYPLVSALKGKLEKLRKPYPKRAVSETVDTPGDQSGERGSIPATALHIG